MTLLSFVILFSISLKGQQQVDTLKLTLAGVNKGIISIDSILKYPVLKCSSNDFEIQSFTFTSIYKGDAYTNYNIGGILSDVIINFIKELKTGTRFWFESINVTKNTIGEKTIIPMNSLSFIVK
jgi:hypothetical protein